MVLASHSRPASFRYFRTHEEHPAGQVGVAIAEWLFGLGWVLPAGGGYHIAPSGLVALHALGARSQELATHTIYSFCTDETEGRHHLSGELGAALTDWLVSREWAQRLPNGQAGASEDGMALKEAGYAGLTSLGVRLPEAGDSDMLHL